MKPFNMYSGDAQRALEDFSTQLDQALAAADPAEEWGTQFGLTNSSRAIKTTYPIPVSAAGYVERKGDDKLRSLYTRSLSIEPVEWVDGFYEKARIVEAPDFIGWAGEPARIAREARRHPNILVADMLNANPFLDFYNDKRLGVVSATRLFANNHPVNVFDTSFGTFDNLGASFSAIDQTLFATAFTSFRNRKGANGRKMRLRPTHLIVPAELEQEAKDFLESDLLRAAFLSGGSNTQETTNNRWKDVVQLVVGDELEDADKVYFVDINGPKPWIVQDGGSPEEITYDKNSERYKDSGEIGQKYILEMAVAACLPHAIEQYTIT